MKKLFFFLIISCSFFSCVKDRIGDVKPVSSGIIDLGNKALIHYWNFNTVNTLLTPTSSIGGASIIIATAYDDVTPGTKLNVRNNNDSASALRVRNPCNEMIVKVPTNGYKDAVFSFAVMRSSSGAQQNLISYTIDGTNYITTGLSISAINVTIDWVAYSIDFTNIPASDNNPNFAVKITFATGNTGVSGNDRFDNITLDANNL
jgi:hypothetical protein